MSEYQAGECNIGEYEIKRRKTAGWFGLILSFVFGSFLVISVLKPISSFLLLPTLLVMNIGFLQAKNSFCAYYGFINRYNLGSKADIQKVIDERKRKADLMKALKLIFQSIVYSLFIVLVLYLLLLFLSK